MDFFIYTFGVIYKYKTMKNKITLGFVALMLTAIISSCSTSNDVASKRRIQKRKYTKGFSISKSENVAFNKKHKASVTSNETVKVDNTTLAKVEKTINSTATNTAIIEETTIITPANEIVKTVVEENQTNTVAENNIVTEAEGEKTAEAKNLKSKTKIVKKKSKKKSSSSNGLAVETIILVILAIFIPPLAVYLFEGVTTRFWIDLILALIVVGYPFAIIYALLIVLGAV